MTALSARLERLEGRGGKCPTIIVFAKPGQSGEEALREKFGPSGQPAGQKVVTIFNQPGSLPDEGPGED